jgi:hypothetical protein
MKNLIFTLIFSLASLIGYGQEIKIKLADKEIETSIVATSSDQLFTNAGNFRFSEIEKITFKAYDSSQLSLYNDLLRKVEIEFEDGQELDSDSIYAMMDQYNKALLLGSDQYLIQASNNALLGIGIPLVGLGVVYLTETPEIGIASGIIGGALIISAWIKVRRAGQALKREKEARISR